MVFDTLSLILKGKDSASPPSMTFDSLSILILKSRGRSVAVIPKLCFNYSVSGLNRESPVAFPDIHFLITLLPTEYYLRGRTRQLAILGPISS
jgi:hypothetical protein